MSTVSRVKDPSNRFGEVIARVDDATDELHSDVTSLFPFLDGEPLYLDVPGTIRGMSSVDDFDGRCIIFIQYGGIIHGKAQLGKNGAKISDGLGT